jgi:hypothetical protein
MNQQITLSSLIYFVFIFHFQSFAQSSQKAPVIEFEVFDSTFIDLNTLGITTSTISLAFAYGNLVPFSVPNEYHATWGMYSAKDFWPIYRKDVFKPTNGSAPTSTAQAYDIDENKNYETVYEFGDRTNSLEPNGQYKLMDQNQNVLANFYDEGLNPENHGGGFSADRKFHYAFVETIPYEFDDDPRDSMIYEDIYVYNTQTGENKKVFDYLHHAGTHMAIEPYQFEGTPNVVANYIDRTHVNAVDNFPYENAAIVSYRHNAIWKVKYIEGSELGEVDWILGGPPGWASSHGFREVVPKIEGQDLHIRMQHSTSVLDSSQVFGILEPGDILVFDNGDTSRRHISRALVIRIEDNDETVTGEIIWEFETGRSEFMGSFKLLKLNEEEGLALINQPHRSDDSMFFALNNFGAEGALHIINNMGSYMFLVRFSTKEILARYRSKMLNYIYSAHLRFANTIANIDCSSPENAAIEFDNVVWHYANGDTIPASDLDPEDFDDLRYFTFSHGINLYGEENTRGFSRAFDFSTCLSTDIDEHLASETSILIQNPTKNKIRFTSAISYQLFNQEGKLVLSGSGNHANAQDLASGIYHLNYTSNNQSKTEKVVLID